MLRPRERPVCRPRRLPLHDPPMFPMQLLPMILIIPDLPRNTPTAVIRSVVALQELLGFVLRYLDGVGGCGRFGGWIEVGGMVVGVGC